MRKGTNLRLTYLANLTEPRGLELLFQAQSIAFMYFLSGGKARWLSGKESACQFRRSRFDSWVEKIL